MDLSRALEIARSAGPATLATVGAGGRPHLSVVLAVEVEGRLWISSTRARVKTRNVRRDPRATLLWGAGPWAAIEGPARVLEGEGVAEALRRYYRIARGEHPDWDDYDRAMVREGRLIIEVEPERAYGFAG